MRCLSNEVQLRSATCTHSLKSPLREQRAQSLGKIRQRSWQQLIRLIFFYIWKHNNDYCFFRALMEDGLDHYRPPAGYIELEFLWQGSKAVFYVKLTISWWVIDQMSVCFAKHHEGAWLPKDRLEKFVILRSAFSIKYNLACSMSISCATQKRMALADICLVVTIYYAPSPVFYKLNFVI